MIKYVVIDNQGGNFMGWTYETPLTKQQIMGYLYSLSNDDKYDDDKWTWDNFRHTFKNDEFCSEWGITLERVENLTASPVAL